MDRAAMLGGPVRGPVTNSLAEAYRRKREAGWHGTAPARERRPAGAPASAPADQPAP